MRLLVDSNVLLWWLQGARTLPSAVTIVMSDGANELLMSAASVWELAIKESTGKLRIDEDLRENALRNGFTELSVTGVHGAAARNLPFHHRDPFDRLLVAQAQVENLTLLTADRMLGSYDVPIMMVDV